MPRQYAIGVPTAFLINMRQSKAAPTYTPFIMKNSLNYSFFTGSALYAFVRALLMIVDSSKLTDGLLKTLLVKLETVFASFSKGFERDANDPLTSEAAQKDLLRDQYYSGMKGYIRSFLKSPDTAKAAAAEKLVAVVRKYGWKAESYSYDMETTSITKCVEEMTTTYSAEVALLGLSDMWITPLSQAQAAFETIQNQRVENGAVDVPTISMYRTPLRKALATFVETLATFAENSDDATLQGYVAAIDELIGRTMATLKASANRGNESATGAGNAAPAAAQ